MIATESDADVHVDGVSRLTDVSLPLGRRDNNYVGEATAELCLTVIHAGCQQVSFRPTVVLMIT